MEVIIKSNNIAEHLELLRKINSDAIFATEPICDPLQPIDVAIQYLNDAPPLSKDCGNSGYDLMANIDSPITIEPGKRLKIPCGISIAMPNFLGAEVRGRSGLTLKGIDCPTGTIDPNYRGEVCAVLVNNSGEVYVVNRLDRIAQLVFSIVVSPNINRTEALPPSNRGSNGFGSSGIN